MTASAAQLRAVAAALTPETIDAYTVGSWLADEFNTDDNAWYLPAFIAATCGNDALRRAVALTLDLEAVRLEQEAPKGPIQYDECQTCRQRRGQYHISGCGGGYCPTCKDYVRQCHCADKAIAALVRAHWAKGAG